MKTSNADVAVINNKAVVTARKKGKCKITFTLSNGKKAVVAVVKTNEEERKDRDLQICRFLSCNFSRKYYT